MEIVENRDRVKKFRERARELVAQMTLEEKVEQTVHYAPAVERLGLKAYNWWNVPLHKRTFSCALSSQMPGFRSFLC